MKNNCFYRQILFLLYSHVKGFLFHSLEKWLQFQTPNIYPINASYELPILFKKLGLGLPLPNLVKGESTIKFVEPNFKSTFL